MLDWLTPEGEKTLEGGYLLPGETLEDAFRRCATASALRLKRNDLSPIFYEAMEKNWLCMASPVLSNLGAGRALPISCFGISVDDSVFGIFNANTELAMMSKNGGGVGICLTNVRARGTRIKGNGVSEGIIPWAKIYDTTISSVSQDKLRRGAGSLNLDITHGDLEEFMLIRRPTGDVNRQCLNLNHCVQVTDDFMHSLYAGDKDSDRKWKDVLRTRLETGEPYITFTDNINKVNPEAYKKNNLKVEMTNICSEIMLHSDPEHSFVCCLSSLNLARYDEWKDYKFSNGMTLPEVGIWFLEGVLEEFIQRGTGVDMMEKAVRSAIKGRALGLGVLGWHSYLQEHMLPFDTSVDVMGLTYRMYKFIREEAEKASREMAVIYGEPEWCSGTGMRHTHLMALAPTANNAIISGNLSPSIEPIFANAGTQKTAKGTFLYKNPSLIKLLDKKGKNKPEVWKEIVGSSGSVQQFDFLSAEEKEVFLTAQEINQFNVIRQAAQRQPFVDQGQSLNLFFPPNVDPDWFNRIHLEAWKSGLKSLYYVRSSSILKGDTASRAFDPTCTACEG